MTTCLVTGGAGFIGSHTVDLLIEKGYRVRILDSLHPCVHPRGEPNWLPRDAEFLYGDVSERADLEKALAGVDVVIHLADFHDHLQDFSAFIHTNLESAALIFELIVAKRLPVRKIVFGSTQSVCGEGKYVCGRCAGDHGLDIKIRYSDESRRVHAYAVLSSPLSTLNRWDLIQSAPPRTPEQLAAGDWDVHCARCGEVMQPALADETTADPISAHAVSKYAVELLVHRLGRRYGIPTVSLRYTYVQGPRQSFTTAYFGVARLFAVRLLHGYPPVCYENGFQLRDYVHVRDVARANLLVLEDDRADFGVYNVGGGRGVTVLEFANLMIEAFGSDLEPIIPGEYRLGDARHAVSDISKLSVLGWRPRIPVEQNVRDYVGWVREQRSSKEYFRDVERIMRASSILRDVSRS